MCWLNPNSEKFVLPSMQQPLNNQATNLYIITFRKSKDRYFLLCSYYHDLYPDSQVSVWDILKNFENIFACYYGSVLDTDRLQRLPKTQKLTKNSTIKFRASPIAQKKAFLFKLLRRKSQDRGSEGVQTTEFCSENWLRFIFEFFIKSLLSRS